MEPCFIPFFLQPIPRVSIESTESQRVGDYDDTPLFTRRSFSKLPQVTKPVVQEKKPPPPLSVPTKYVGPSKEFPPKCSAYFWDSIFGAILEDTCLQLRFIANCNNSLLVTNALSLNDSLLRKKFSVAESKISDDEELDRIDVKNLDCLKYKLRKWAADRNFVTETMLSTYSDLSLKACFTTLVTTNQNIMAQMNRREELQAEQIRNKAIRQELVKQLRYKLSQYKSVIYETDNRIERLQRQLEDASTIADVQERYIDNWEIARTEQNTLVIHEKEIGPTEAIKYYRKQWEYEMRVHSEVELITNLFITETLEKIDEWMKKYDKDIDDIDFRIQLRKTDYLIQQEANEDLEKLYEKRDIEMEKWVNFKKERERIRAHREKMTSAAIAVQAWWRGLLVRLQLGPYKPKKVKPTMPKKKKK